VFTENLDAFLADFGVPVEFGLISGTGILDMPAQMISDGMVITTDYKLTVRADEFGTLKYGDQVMVNSVLYQVREPMLIDDGAFLEVSLTKLAESDQEVTFIYDGNFEAEEAASSEEVTLIYDGNF
jgi:hypothetical protein